MTDEQKKHYAIFALIGVAAIALIVYLLRSSATVASSVTSPDGSSPSYPNSQPLNLGDITVQGSPSNITYNNSGQGIIPTVAIAPPPSSGSCCGDCIPAGQLTITNNVPQNVVSSGYDNLSGFINKLNGVAVGSPAPADAYSL